MNLVQINERLKDLPMQVIQQYANGMNPEVPPYLALGELQRRETAQKRMATAQGGAQGPQPSVKEQVEQKAGLMAAQAMQQQQMAQQQVRPQGPMPAPAGVPQPEAQPEAMMARGGLTRAPVRFSLQHGGIVAFSGETGSEVKAKYETPYDRMNRENRENAAKPPESELEALMAARERYVRAGADTSAIDQAIATLKERARAPISRPTSQMTPQQMEAPSAGLPGALAPSSRPTSQMTPQQMEAKVKPVADLKALAEQKRRQQAPQPTPAPAVEAPAATATPAPNSMDAMLREQLNKGTKETTLAEQLAEQKAAREGAGMTEPAGKAQMERIRQLQSQYESSKPSGMDDLIRVFGQAGQYKGMTGTGPAYTANQDRKRAADLNMAAKINELMGGVETTQRGEMKEVASGALSGLGSNRTARSTEAKEKLSALSSGRTADLQSDTQRRGQDIQLEVGKMQAAATREARAQGADDKQITAAEAAYARDPEAAIIKKRLESPLFTNNPEKAAPDLKRLREIQASKYRQFGIKLEGAPDASSSGGTSLKYNPKTGKIE
jgi:hypothetical protein